MPWSTILGNLQSREENYCSLPKHKKRTISKNSRACNFYRLNMIEDWRHSSLFTLTKGGKYFDVSARLDKQACPVVYNGLTGRGVFHECIADFQLNGLTQGWGLAEFYYR